VYLSRSRAPESLVLGCGEITSPIYRTRPYMVIILRVFWLVTLKMPVTPVILLHNLYSSCHW
jgi:hypothetical protein